MGMLMAQVFWWKEGMYVMVILGSIVAVGSCHSGCGVTIVVLEDIINSWMQ